ncbi:MAG: hypothetical protein LBV30_05350 [Propionibacteriaceae bacterium]|jgi:hypothetical protein|nr:hypothetical protein [Propionibacteriaceae bacterium]
MIVVAGVIVGLMLGAISAWLWNRGFIFGLVAAVIMIIAIVLLVVFGPTQLRDSVVLAAAAISVALGAGIMRTILLRRQNGPQSRKSSA